VVDRLGLPDPPIEFDVELGMPSIPQAQHLEMLGLAARFADRLEAGRAAAAIATSGSADS
jgi:hypothetical protein